MISGVLRVIYHRALELGENKTSRKAEVEVAAASEQWCKLREETLQNSRNSEDVSNLQQSSTCATHNTD